MRNSPTGADHLPGGGDDPVDLWERGVLEVLGVGHRDLGAAHACDRGVELEEGVLDDPRAHLGGDAPAAPPLVDDDDATGAPRTLASIVSVSSGRRTRRSITSASMPSAASCSAAARTLGNVPP